MSATHCETNCMRQHHCRPRIALLRTPGARRSLHRRVCAFATIDPSKRIQLATAKLPAVVATDAFVDGMFQWASTLTSSGQNMPFALPLAADRTDDGFDISFLRVVSGEIFRIACISCTVEAVDEDNVFFARFKAIDPYPDGRVAPGNDDEKLRKLLDATVDVPLIMNTMGEAIKRMVLASAQASKLDSALGNVSGYAPILDADSR